MKSALAIVAGLGVALAMMPAAQAQNASTPQRICLATLIQSRLTTQQPVRLSAETVTLTGDTLRLVGRATVRFDDTTIRFEEIVLNQSSNRIEFLGNGRLFLGTGSPCAGPVPKVDFR